MDIFLGVGSRGYSLPRRFSAIQAGDADDEGSAIYSVKIPPGYRAWEMDSVAHEAGNLNDIRAILGIAVAIKAFRDGTLPFPNGTTIARLAWRDVPSDENNAVFGQFEDGKPVRDEALLKTCFPCHEPGKGHDFVFTRYAP